MVNVNLYSAIITKSLNCAYMAKFAANFYRNTLVIVDLAMGWIGHHVPLFFWYVKPFAYYAT